MSADLKQPNNDYNQDYDQQDESEDQKPEFDDENQEDFDGDDQQQQIGGVSGEGPKYVRLRGLPWSATHQEILDFLKNIHVINGSKGIHLVTSRWDGKNTGEAFVEVQSQTDVDEAHKLNKGLMGHRYIEVFDANAKEAQQAMKKTGGPGTSYVVKLRGLPYAVTEQQVEEFFNGLEIKPDREGILFVMDRRGRATGEAYVQFESQEDTEQALGRNREKIGHRYIEIFRSSLAELKRSSNGNGRPGPYDLKERGGNRGGDFGGNGGSGRNNMRGGGDWNSGGFGVGANNTLGFSSLGNFNSGNFGNGGGGGFGGNNGGGFGGGNNAGNFGNGGGGFGGGNNRFNGPNNGGGGNGGGGNFSSDFGDFGNFGNNRNNNFNNGSNDFADDNSFSGRGNNGGNFGTGGNFGNLGNFGNFGNSGLAAGVGVGGGGSGGGGVGGGSGGNMGNFNTNMGVNNAGGGGNFGPIGGGRNDSEFFSVHMRGLPYSSYENDIFKFFDPIRPANVRINFNKKGLHSGTSDVFFDTYEDAQLAMKRHKEQMGNRYIELFFDGKTKGGNPSGGGGGGNNMGNNFSRRI